MSKKERILYLDCLRVLATFTVVILHTASQTWHITDVHSYHWQVLNIYDSIVRFTVPIFVMISGALFLDNNKVLNIRNLYTKNIFRIVTAFIFWSALYAVVYYKPGNGLSSLITSFLKGHYHLWFCYMIIGLYIITPLLRKITADSQSTLYFLILSLICTFVLPTIIDITNSTTLTAMFAKTKWHFTLGFSSYFICGYYLCKVELSKKQQHFIYFLGLLGFLSTILISSFVALQKGKPFGYYENFTINVMLESISVFVFFKYKISNLHFSQKSQKMISILSSCSFGIYLVHILVLDSLEKLGLYTLSFNAIISVPIIALTVFLISFIISAVIHRIPVLKKYII